MTEAKQGELNALLALSKMLDALLKEEVTMNNNSVRNLTGREVLELLNVMLKQYVEKRRETENEAKQKKIF